MNDKYKKAMEISNKLGIESPEFSFEEILEMKIKDAENNLKELYESAYEELMKTSTQDTQKLAYLSGYQKALEDLADENGNELERKNIITVTEFIQKVDNDMKERRIRKKD